MIGRTNVGGGGGGNVSFTLNAVKGETVTITQNGATVLTVTMPDIVQASTAVTLPKGTYSFTGSISEYIATVELDKGTKTVNVFPEGAIYWYGRNLLGGGFDSETKYNKTKPTITVDLTDIDGYLPSGSSDASAQWLLHTVNEVDGSGYTSIKAKVTTVVTYSGSSVRGYAIVGINTTKAYTAAVSGLSEKASGTYEIVANIAEQTMFYPCFGGNKGGTYANTLHVTMNALWME